MDWNAYPDVNRVVLWRRQLSICRSLRPASLLPALVTLLICFATRNVILALFMGVVMGGLISGQFNILQSYLIPSLGSKKYAEILLVYLWALGGLIGLWNKNGGAIHLQNTLPKGLLNRENQPSYSLGQWASYFIRVEPLAPFWLERRSSRLPIARKSLMKNCPIS